MPNLFTSLRHSQELELLLFLPTVRSSSPSPFKYRLPSTLPDSPPSDMEESKPPRRMKGVTVCLPIAYGSIAWHMTKKTEQDQCTHQWTCEFAKNPPSSRGCSYGIVHCALLHTYTRTVYVRSPHGHDLGAVLKKTVFTLHSSFNNHIRGMSSPWREFLFFLALSGQSTFWPGPYGQETDVGLHDLTSLPFSIVTTLHRGQRPPLRSDGEGVGRVRGPDRRLLQRCP